MRRFRLEQSKTEILTPHAGLALVGHAINRCTALGKSLQQIPKRHGISNIDLVRAFVGQLCLGKSDFEAIENVRQDRFFKAALGIGQMPSSARLRQRFDEDARALIEHIDTAAVGFVEASGASVTPLSTGHVALDMDVFPMDNSGTAKEGVSRTYKGHDGYAPIAGYLGQEGWCITCELREGSWHSQKEFGHVLERTLPRARQLTDAPILVRLDSGHDARDNRLRLAREQVDFLIKWNPRSQDQEAWISTAEARVARGEASWSQPREGKRTATFSETLTEKHGDESFPVRRVIRITERTIDRHGQHLILPEIQLDGWWTSLAGAALSDEAVIALYRDHATSEQFHSEFKTDLDLERLPSGKFDTNDLVMTMAMLAYNILRWIGLQGLMGPESPVRHPARRRRLRTVMQELMYLAAHVVQHARTLVLRFARHCPGFASFEVVYNQLVPT